MSIHPSLSSSEKAKKVRSVLKRAERLKILMDKDSWKQGQSIFALPKIKTIRIKIKKEKAAPAAAEAAAEGEAVAATEVESTSATEKPAKPTKSPESPKSKESKK